MKREFKFRAWHKDLKIMLYDITIYPDMIGLSNDDFEKAISDKYELLDDTVYDKDNNIICSVLVGDDWIWLENEDVEIMQYTGIKDKNGKEIYEGDIIEIKSEKHRDIRFYKVVFENCSFICYHKYGRWGLLSRFWDADLCLYKEHIEIAGNIYETPKLLENV